MGDVILSFPSKHFLFPKTSSRRLEDVFSVTLFVFQDVLKKSWRRLQDVFAIRLPKTSSRPPQDILQDVFKTFSRRLQDVFQDIFKTYLRRLGRQKNVTLKTSSLRLHQDECLLGWFHDLINGYLIQLITFTAQKMKISIKDFFSKCDQICRFLRIWSHLPKKSIMENFIFCAVFALRSISTAHGM